jgi:hypothetical protein
VNLFLRAFGLIVAAGWFGSVVFGLGGLTPSTGSEEMRILLGPNFPYFSGAIRQLFFHKLFLFQLICALLMMLHMFTEWLYLGQTARRSRLLLVGGIVCLMLCDGLIFQRQAGVYHRAAHAVNAGPGSRESAARSFRTWHALSNVVNSFLLVGLAVQLWRMANPPEPTRFVSAAKFRS